MSELVDMLANEIHSVDGAHSLGAGALAEKLMPFLRLQMSLAEVEAREKALREAAEIASNTITNHAEAEYVGNAILALLNKEEGE